MTAADWTAIAAWLTFGVAVAAAAFAAVQTLVAAADRRARQRPHVIVDLDRFGNHHGSVRLSVANIGQTTARDVRLTFDPPLPEPPDGDAMAEYVRRFTDRTWGYMPPGKVHDTMFVHLIGYPEDAGRAWTVKIDCSDYKGRSQPPETTQIDLDDIALRVSPDTLTVHELATDIRKIGDWLEKLPVDGDGVHTVTESRESVTARRTAARERQWLGRRRLTERLRAADKHSQS